MIIIENFCKKTMKVGKSFNLGLSKPTYDGISQYFKQTPT